MSSTNISGRSSGCISIPIEIIPSSNSTYSSRYISSLQTNRYDDYSNSPPWKKPSYIKTRFQPRQTPLSSYDRLIKESHFNDRHTFQPSNSFVFSRSNEDLLSSSTLPNDLKQSFPQYDTHNYRSDSDFIHQSNPFRRSFDHLNDFSQSRSTSVRMPQDQSHSPDSECDESPNRSTQSPSSTSQKRTQESDFKVTPKDATTISNDQQVPLTERDINAIALEKLEQIKQHLASLNEQVEAYNGSTRNDRIYKELDEQALKMMLTCDELVNVNTDIKEKRKEMIQNVQTVLAKLESKVPINPENNQMDNALVIFESSINNNTEQKKEDEKPVEQST